MTGDYPEQWNKSHLPVTYPLTRSACKVDAFLFFQSECRFSHFSCCVSSFSITISVLDGPLKQMKDIHRPSSRFLCYSYAGEGALTPPVYSRETQLSVLSKPRAAGPSLGGWSHPRKPGQLTYYRHLRCICLRRTRIGIGNSKSLLVAFTVVQRWTYCLYSFLPPKIQKIKKKKIFIWRRGKRKKYFLTFLSLEIH